MTGKPTPSQLLKFTKFQVFKKKSKQSCHFKMSKDWGCTNPWWHWAGTSCTQVPGRLKLSERARYHQWWTRSRSPTANTPEPHRFMNKVWLMSKLIHHGLDYIILGTVYVWKFQPGRPGWKKVPIRCNISAGLELKLEANPGWKLSVASVVLAIYIFAHLSIVFSVRAAFFSCDYIGFFSPVNRAEKYFIKRLGWSLSMVNRAENQAACSLQSAARHIPPDAEQNGTY